MIGAMIEGYDEYVENSKTVAPGQTPVSESEILAGVEKAVERVQTGETANYMFAYLDTRNKDVVEFDFEALPDEEEPEKYQVRYIGMS